MVKCIKGLCLAGLAAVLVWTAVPQTVVADGHMAAVEARQKAMRGFGGAMKASGMFLKSGQGSLADIEQRLRRMASAADKIPGWFPKGTSSDDLGIKTSGAKPAIWADMEGLKKAAANFGKKSGELAQIAAKGDKAAFGAAFKSYGKEACGTCHRQFRAKRPKN
ncbi:MAG: cytochrome c [Sphingomonadales bacterium]|nr:cytochrome c [Sphingomonadales bacterium]